jgi:ABC-type uncharacterized transport system auxiliary subunit
MKPNATLATHAPQWPCPQSSVRRRRVARVPLAAALAAAALLGGCSMFDRPAPTASHFLLDVPAQPRAEGAVLGSIVVRRATAISPYDARGFVYRLANGEWRIDAYNGFLTEPSDMISDALMRGLGQTGRFGLVSGPGFVATTDFALETVVEAFYADFSDPARPAAVVQLRSYVTDRSGGVGSVLQSLSADARVALPDGSPRGVSQGMSAAVGEAIARLVAQLPDGPWARAARAG